MLSTEQAAIELGVSKRRVQELVRTGALEAKKISGAWLIDENSVTRRASSVMKSGGRPARGHGKNETTFIFMNRTHEIAKLVYDASRKSFTYISSDFDSQYAPVGLSRSGRPIALAEFNRWWRGRGIPQSRSGFAHLLEEAGVSLPEELLQRNLGLSLSDQYWIKPEESELNWHDINFFNNDFSQVSLATEAFVADGKNAAAKPDNTSDGNLQKTWVCRSGQRFLLKGGTQYGQEPYNEAVATLLHSRLLDSGEYVPYSVEGEGPMALSCCPLFLTDEEEYIPAIYVERYARKSSSQNDFEHYLACCEALGVSGAKTSLEHMIVCDDVLANHDRHHRTFGLIRNVETGACRPAPIFDSGSSLWCDIPTSALAAGEHSYVSKQFYESPAKQMLLVDDLSWFDAKKLNGFIDEAVGILSANDALTERIPYIKKALEWRLDRMISIAEWS